MFILLVQSRFVLRSASPLLLIAASLTAGPIGPTTAVRCNATIIMSGPGPTSCGNALLGAESVAAGRLSLGAESHITLNGETGPFTAAAGAAFSEMVTFSGLYSRYSVTLTLALGGTITTTGNMPAPTVALTWLPYGPSGGSQAWNNTSLGWTGTQSYTLISDERQFDAGVPYNWIVQLFAFSERTTSGASLTGTAIADILHTATIVSGVVTDPDGNPVPGTTYTTASGNALPLEGALHVPEPATIIQLCCGVLLCWYRRR